MHSERFALALSLLPKQDCQRVASLLVLLERTSVRDWNMTLPQTKFIFVSLLDSTVKMVRPQLD